ncbi:hypothetical protein Mal4_45370 [Maioricimonas rarisocia]|uniref:Uncharacterized protein n=1 Tax=Maioricimonas rarisocia TaxID=2528026 RepID=A0A517ZCK2_9PLAN|nr:hypothetical protein [Maioricimonas rarisocia]QDU40182.1 hypothetical protein Mal4_45370 [Maioricimonas rarisocia]
MSGWLAKASSSLRQENTESPQPFVLTCECGLEHNGLRRARHQRIICKTCGASLFVLPKDAYPLPAARKPKKKRKKKRGARGRQNADTTSQQVGQLLIALPSVVGGGVRSAGSRMLLSLRQTLSGYVAAFRNFWTPFRLVILGVVIMIGFTLAMVARSRALDAAREVVRVAGDAGVAALDSGDIAKAREQFADAAAALDQLGRDDPEAERIRQRWRETTAMTRLLPQDLYALIEDGDHAAAAGIEDEWEEEFRSRHSGKWIVLELPVAHDVENDRYRAPYSLPVGTEGRVVTIDVDVPVMSKLTFGDAPRTVIMAAPLRSCSLMSDRRSWTLTLQPERAFLWTHLDTYEEVGFGFDDWQPRERVRQILESQAAAIGAISPTTEQP